MHRSKKKEAPRKTYDELLAEMLQELITDKERGRKKDNSKYRDEFERKLRKNGLHHSA